MKTKKENKKIKTLTGNLTEAFKLLTKLPGDFMIEGRQDLPPQERNFNFDEDLKK